MYKSHKLLNGCICTLHTLLDKVCNYFCECEKCLSKNQSKVMNLIISYELRLIFDQSHDLHHFFQLWKFSLVLLLSF